jgi:hypothetical protein
LAFRDFQARQAAYRQGKQGIIAMKLPLSSTAPAPILARTPLLDGIHGASFQKKSRLESLDQDSSGEMRQVVEN